MFGSPADDRLFLTWTGMETDLIFNRGVALQNFALYPLLEREADARMIADLYRDFVGVARRTGCGAILESPTWVANRDRAAAIGYAPDRLAEANRRSVELVARVRDEADDVPTILSGNVGPRADGYAPGQRMSEDEAEAYHAEQIEAFARAGVDIVSAYTMTHPEEAVGVVRAARRAGLPVVISFTVETDGRLPVGMPLADAITEVDARTDGAASHFMVNCAHPDHFADVLGDGPAIDRLRGLVVNASRCSHAELDEAEELDDGDPQELGRQMAWLVGRHPGLRVVGGCCGTDLRHIAEIGTRTREARQRTTAA